MRKKKGVNLKAMWEKRTTQFGPRKQKEWVYLGKEMKKKALENKPINEKVKRWLHYLKELKDYQTQQLIEHEKKLTKTAGPIWYVELSLLQRQILNNLSRCIHQDLIQEEPVRTRKALRDLGISLKFTDPQLYEPMKSCLDDPGIFIWNLYTDIYKTRPSDKRSEYDINAMILMSSLVFIDLEDCIRELNRVTDVPRSRGSSGRKPRKPPSDSSDPYLNKQIVKPFTPNERPRKRIGHLQLQFELKSALSYEKIRADEHFLKLRREQCEAKQTKVQMSRKCKYKFWVAPPSLRTSDPSVLLMKMLKKKAKMKCEPPFQNTRYHVIGVTFVRGRPCYQMQTVCMVPTGYIIINAGTVNKKVNENVEAITHIDGCCLEKRTELNQCEKQCSCLSWEPIVMEYLKESKCKCGHLYDLYNTPDPKRPLKQYFTPANRHGPCCFDHAKILAHTSVEDFIKDTVKKALQVKDTSPPRVRPTMTAANVEETKLVQQFLSELAGVTGLIIPHLPDAYKLKNLREWARSRVKGKLSQDQHKQLILKAMRHWMQLAHMNFRPLCHLIPFTVKQLNVLNWDKRIEIQELYNKIYENFKLRLSERLLKQTRLFWSTMDNDTYFNQAFLNIFFTYLPNRFQDVYILNPFDPTIVNLDRGKTCPLDD